MYPFQCDPSPQKRLAGSTPETVPPVPSAPGAEHVNGDTSALLLPNSRTHSLPPYHSLPSQIEEKRDMSENTEGPNVVLGDGTLYPTYETPPPPYSE